MKKLLFVLFLFVGLSLPGFAATAMESVDFIADVNEVVDTTLNNDSENATDKDETKNDTVDAENMDSEEDTGCCPSSNCAAYVVLCTCGATFEAQWCSGGCCPHNPNYDDYFNGLCIQACGLS